MVLKYHVEADIYINYMILACDLHYSIKLISKKIVVMLDDKRFTHHHNPLNQKNVCFQKSHKS